jgi:ParB family transcriptional regulator, chromosome partitioning protein
VSEEKKLSRFGALPVQPTLSASLTGVALRPRGSPKDGPITPVGRMAEDVGKSYLQQIEELRQERAAGKVVLSLDPNRIRATAFANRDARSYAADDPAMEALREDIRANGQEIPIKVRPVAGDAAYDFEIVWGHRRHRACLELDRVTEGGFRVNALVDAGADDTRTLVLKMFRENEVRTNPSPFERGVSWAQWLSEGLFDNATVLGKAIGVDHSTVSKTIQLAELPSAILAAFGDPRDISLRWVTPLLAALESDERGVRTKAERQAKLDPRPPAESVFAALTGEQVRANRRSGRSSRTESVRIGSRVPVKVGQAKNKITLRFHQVTPELQKQLNADLKDWVEAWLKNHLPD